MSLLTKLWQSDLIACAILAVDWLVTGCWLLAGESPSAPIGVSSPAKEGGAHSVTVTKGVDASMTMATLNLSWRISRGLYCLLLKKNVARCPWSSMANLTGDMCA